MTIEWKPDCPAEQLVSLDHLLVRIAEIEAAATEDAAMGLILHHHSGAEVVAYVATHHWWFMWTPDDYPEKALGSFHSTASLIHCVESGQLMPESLIDCYLFGHHGELDLRDAVDSHSARVAISQFYSSPERPNILTWIPD